MSAIVRVALYNVCPVCHVPLAGPSLEMFTIAEAAAYLHCGRRTVDRMIAAGVIRPVKLSRRFCRVPLAELRRLAGRQEFHECPGCGGAVREAGSLCFRCERSPADRARGREFLRLLAGVADPGRPTDATPGTPAKVAVLAARARAGLPLWLDGEPTLFARDLRGCAC
jgi:excisionase family DNA binding protein